MADNFYGLTDTGKERKNNEDSFIAQQGYNDRFAIACVIDGVGGYAGGEIAAALTHEVILQRLSRVDDEIASAITDAFLTANEKIWEEKQRVKEYSSMACVATLAVVDLENNQFYFAHVGDTRLYLLRDGSLVKISHDQSFVGFLEDSGRLTEKEAMNHPKRNEIDKALGFKAINADNTDYIETGQSPFLPGDMIMLCSDGLTDLVDKETITHILTTDATLKTKCVQLIDAANYRGGRDNITVVLVENNKTTKQHEATKPKAIEHGVGQVAPVQDIKAPLVEKKKTAGSTYKGLAIFLAILTVALIIICAWQFTNKPAMQPQAMPVISLPKTQNAQEIKLQDAINHSKTKVLLLADTAYKSPIIISRAIQISRDTFYIKAKGNITLQADSGYKGPAFALTSNCKHITLDSLSFHDFGIAVTALNSALALKNDRFINCPFAVQNSLPAADNKYVNGDLSTQLFKTDSLPQKAKPHGAR